MNEMQNNEIRSYLDWAGKGRSAWWLYLIGFVTFELILSIGNGLFNAILGLVLPRETITGHNTITALGFLPTFLAVPLFVWLLHARPGWSVAFPRLKRNWWNLWVGFLFALIVNLALYISYVLLGGSKLSFQVPDFSVYLPVFILGFFTIFFQTTSEEFLYRGYIMQFMRRLTANPVLLVALSAAVFSAPHASNLVMMGMPWYNILLYISDGAIMGFLAYRSRSLWMPIGWHWANNFGLVVLYGLKDSKDVYKSVSIILVDKFPSDAILIISSIVINLLAVLNINWLLNRREKTSAE